MAHNKKRILILFFLLGAYAALPAPALAAGGGFPFLGVLRAGSSPEAVAVDTQTHLVYIAYEDSGRVVGFDPVSGQVRWRAAIGNVVTDVQVDSATHRVYAVSASFGNGQNLFAMLDGATGKTLFTFPFKFSPSNFADNNIAVDSTHQRVFITDDQAGSIDLFLPPTAGSQSVTASIVSFLTTGLHKQSIGVNSRLGRLYLADADQHTLAVFDENSGKKLASIPICTDAVPPVRVDEVSGRVYIVCSQGQELDIINGKTNSVLARIPVSPYPEGVAFNTATGRIYVADEGNLDSSNSDDNDGTTITVIDGQSFTVLGTLQVGRGPDGVEADPALRRIYVSVESSNALVEISDSTGIPLQGAPNLRQTAAISQAVSLLQKAALLTLCLMLVTLVLATRGALLRRSRARESLQTPPGGASSHSATHTPPV